jgi:hypothetical protein
MMANRVPAGQRSRLVPLLPILAALLCRWTPSSAQDQGERDRSHVVQGREWEAWPSTATRAEDRDGALPVKSVVWKDAGGRPWHMDWTGKRFQVQGPTSRKAIDRHAMAANREDPDTMGEPEMYRWSREGWECFVIQWEQRGVEMGRSVFWVIAVDSATGEWVLRRGHHWWEGPPSLAANPRGLRLEWEDESEDGEPFLNAEYRWEVHRNASSLTVRAFPTRYRVVVSYPVFGNIRAAASAPNPLEAIHAGWRSLSWRLESVGPGGGRATSHRAVLPEFWEEQAAALRELVGRWPRLALPPKEGQEEFRWNGEVLLCRKGRRLVSISAERAARLASSGSWGIVLARSGVGPCEAWILVEGSPQAAPGSPASPSDSAPLVSRSDRARATGHQGRRE